MIHEELRREMIGAAMEMTTPETGGAISRQVNVFCHVERSRDISGS
jgi:hypothetical protein